MLDYQEILNSLPMDQIAAQVGEPQTEVENAVRNALPALLMGLGANAQDADGAASINNALQGHDPALLDGVVDISQIDTADGEKITHHIFGSNEDAVVDQLGGLGGGGGLIQKLLPILAPIVMAWLARSLMSGGKAEQQAPQADPGGGILGDLLEGLLGGGGQAPAPKVGKPSDAQFRVPGTTSTGSGAPTMPFPDDVDPRPQTQQNQPGSGGLGDGVLGQILGDLLGGGRR